jgi:hypothetical protein
MWKANFPHSNTRNLKRYECCYIFLTCVGMWVQSETRNKHVLPAWLLLLCASTWEGLECSYIQPSTSSCKLTTKTVPFKRQHKSPDGSSVQYFCIKSHKDHFCDYSVYIRMRKGWHSDCNKHSTGMQMRLQSSLKALQTIVSGHSKYVKPIFVFVIYHAFEYIFKTSL